MPPQTSPQINPEIWNACISSLPGAHILQTSEWGEVKTQFGWQPHYLSWIKEQSQIELSINKNLDKHMAKQVVAAALVLHRKITFGGFSHRMSVMYVPKGPLLDWADVPLRQQILNDLKAFAQKHNAIFIKIDPDVEIGIGVPGINGSSDVPLGEELSRELQSGGWLLSDEQIQFRNTVLIDLRPGEAELLANMKQKTRYNVNLAIRKGVLVRPGKIDDLNMLYKMYAETSIRDGFVIRNEGYYMKVWGIFMGNQTTASREQPVAQALIAEVDGNPVAGAIIFRFAGKAWYLYGMSRCSPPG